MEFDIQKVAEEQTDTMPSGRGAIVVADPNNGEIWAMVSRPAFDPNLFSQRAKTPEGIIAARAIGRRPFDPIAYQAALEILG